MAASFSPGASARLFRLDVRIAAWATRCRHDGHFVARRRWRNVHPGINVARRMDHTAGAIEPLAEILVTRMRLRIKLARRILIGRSARAWFGGQSGYWPCGHEA